MTETFIANLSAATVVVALLVAVCRIAFLVASGPFDEAAEVELESAISGSERRAA